MSIHIDDNLEYAADGAVSCRHCGSAVGAADEPLRGARVREAPPSSAGPGVRTEARNYTERTVVLRQSFCPGCLALLQSEIVPGDEPSLRGRSLRGQP